MSTPSYGQITHNGLWKNNPALVQLLGLCPLLAVTRAWSTHWGWPSQRCLYWSPQIYVSH